MLRAFASNGPRPMVFEVVDNAIDENKARKRLGPVPLLEAHLADDGAELIHLPAQNRFLFRG